MTAASQEVWAVLPVKDLAGAKQRLAPILEDGERSRLAELMLADVLGCLSRVGGLSGVALVTRDERAAAMGRDLGARVIREPANTGQSAAVARAAKILAAEGARTILTVPGDVPGARPEEYETVLAAQGPAPALTIVPGWDGKGSNCLACSPPDLIPFQFGLESFPPHLAAARKRGVEPKVLSLPGIALDLDGPEEVRRFLQTSGGGRARQYLLKLNARNRIAALSLTAAQ